MKRLIMFCFLFFFTAISITGKIVKDPGFSLIKRNKTYYIRVITKAVQKEIPVTSAIIPYEKEYLYCDIPFEIALTDYCPQITAFSITPNLVGLHLSSYRITEGSAEIAAGTDAFLIYNMKTGRLRRSSLELEVSRGRYRISYIYRCAVYHSFIVSDINRDDWTDLGVVREEITCYEDTKDEDHHTKGPYYRLYPAKWYIWGGEDFRYAKEYDGRFPETVFEELPLLGLVKSPVDTVKDWYGKKYPKGRK